MIIIEPYQDHHADAFKFINQSWIEEYIGLNKEDHLILNNPQKMIIDKGGNIQVAIFEGEPIGTICLEKSGERLMITKLGVLKSHRGMGAGKKLCASILKVARKQGASDVWLETSQRLQTAIGLYKKLGFEDMNANNRSSRCDVLMRLVL